MSDASPPSQPVDPVSTSAFIMWRLTQLEHQFTQLDQQGSRGVAGLVQRVDQLAREFTLHEQQHENARKEQVSSRRWLLGLVALLITPLYPLLFAVLRLKGI